MKKAIIYIYVRTVCVTTKAVISRTPRAFPKNEPSSHLNPSINQSINPNHPMNYYSNHSTWNPSPSPYDYHDHVHDHVSSSYGRHEKKKNENENDVSPQRYHTSHPKQRTTLHCSPHTHHAHVYDDVWMIYLSSSSCLSHVGVRVRWPRGLRLPCRLSYLMRRLLVRGRVNRPGWMDECG